MFDKTSNLCFLTAILMLTAIHSNQIPISTADKNTADNPNEKPDFSLIQILKSNKENSSPTKPFDDLLEDIFTSEDITHDPWLNSEYSKLLKDLNSQEEENYFSQANKAESAEHNAFVYINEKEDGENLLKSFCNQEKLDLGEKMKIGESHIFDLESEKRHLSNEISSLEDKVKTNEEKLKAKSKEIKDQASELKALKNPTNDYYSSNEEALIILESLISLVKNYYGNLEQSRVDKDSNGVSELEKFESNFISLASKAGKLEDYSLSSFLSELANKHSKASDKGMRSGNNINLLEYKSETKNKILEVLENIKKKYEDKRKEIKESLESEIALKEKGLENNAKLLELINGEVMKYNNDLLIHKQRLENTIEALSAYKNNIEKLSGIISDLNKICI